MLTRFFIILNRLKKINLKTIYFNFKYLPFSQAVHIPILISTKVCLSTIKGKIIIEAPLTSGLIKIGYGDIRLFDKKKSRTIWDVSGTVVFKGKTHIGHGSKISVWKDGELILGKNFTVNAESTIVASKKVEFGDNCLLSWDILIMDTDYHPILDFNGVRCNPSLPIHIGNKVWIGCRCLILKGAQIPDQSVIAANSMVNKKLEGENNVFGGTPVRILKKEVTWIM
jgi:acetyltransferase-like isoleucine patch superfamily enzyme